MLDAGKASFLWGRGSTQLASVCKPAFGRHWGDVPAGEGQFCSEARMPESEHSMPPALGQPYSDITGFKWYCPMKEQAAGVCQT